MRTEFERNVSIIAEKGSSLKSVEKKLTDGWVINKIEKRDNLYKFNLTKKS